MTLKKETWFASATRWIDHGEALCWRKAKDETLILFVGLTKAAPLLSMPVT